MDLSAALSSRLCSPVETASENFQSSLRYPLDLAAARAMIGGRASKHGFVSTASRRTVRCSSETRASVPWAHQHAANNNAAHVSNQQRSRKVDRTVQSVETYANKHLYNSKYSPTAWHVHETVECRVCADVRGGLHAGTRPDDPPPVTAAPQGVESPR